MNIDIVLVLMTPTMLGPLSLAYYSKLIAEIDK